MTPDFRNNTDTEADTHWYMSRSPVTISARPPASASTAASDPSRSSASTSGEDSTPQPNAENNSGARENCHANASGTGGRSAWYAGNSSTRYEAASAPKHVTIARGPKSAAALSSRLTAPSSAFTERPSSPRIESGSAKNERYSTYGASTAISGPGIRRPSLAITNR